MGDVDAAAFDLGRPLGRFRQTVEPLLLVAGLGGPVQEREGGLLAVGARMGDGRFLHLAGREPLVLLAQFGRQFGDRPPVLDGQLRAADEGDEGRRCDLGVDGHRPQAVFLGRGRAGLVGDPLEPRLDRAGQDQAAEREVVDQDERLIVPVIGADGPAHERADRPPFLDLPGRAAGLPGGLGIQDGLDGLAGIAQDDGLAAVDLLDLLARHGVQGFDPPLVHDRHLAELVVGRPGARPYHGLVRPGARAGGEGRGQDQTGVKLGESSHGIILRRLARTRLVVRSRIIASSCFSVGSARPAPTRASPAPPRGPSSPRRGPAPRPSRALSFRRR